MKYVDNPFQLPSLLCIGPGILGLERGLERAIGKTKPICLVEVEAFILANLIAGMEAGMVDAVPVFTDVKKFEKVAKHFRKKICGVVAGYNCQPFSLAGKRKGAEDPRHVWPSISRIIKTTGPVWCLFENVSGHLSLGYDQVYRDLREMGYAVESGIFTAEEVGAPHERERLFILAISNGTRLRWHSEGRLFTDFINDDKKMANSNSNSKGSGNTRGGWVESSNGSTEPMGDTEGSDGGLSVCQPGQERRSEINSTHSDGTSETEMAYATGAGQQELGDHGKPASTKNNRACNPSTELSNADQQLLEIRKCQPGNDEQECQALAGIYNQWPSGPGEPQQAWEEPRTKYSRIALPNDIRALGKRLWKDYRKTLSKDERKEIEHKKYATTQPGLGLYVDGYHFREDLLRAIGNSVVEQTAEIAFIHLLKKHLKNIGQ